MGVMNKKEEYKKIGASLQYGIVFTKKWRRLTWIFLSCCIIVPITSIFYLFLLGAGVESFAEDIVVSLVGGNIVTLLCAGIYEFLLFKQYRLKKAIYLWFDDMIELNADTRSIDKKYWFGVSTKLKIEFCYDKKKYSFQSGEPAGKFDWLINNNGYFKVLTKYADRKVKILFSPKYEQILILKDK